MSLRCWGVNRIVFIPPPRRPHDSNHQGAPPRPSGNCRKYWTGETIPQGLGLLLEGRCPGAEAVGAEAPAPQAAGRAGWAAPRFLVHLKWKYATTFSRMRTLLQEGLSTTSF